MWHWCEKGEPLQAAKEIAAFLLDAGQKVFPQDQARGKQLITHAMKAHDLSRLEAMLKMAASEPGMTINIQEIDSNPWLLGVLNGVIDLKSGSLLVNDPSMLITRRCLASYDRNAQCPRWMQFLNEVFSADLETIETIQRALGYTLTGSVKEEVLFICHGFGSNGKSVFNNVIASIMGDYACVAPTSLLTVRRDGDASPRNDLASLVGSRYVAINELQSGDRLDEQLVKLLAGRESISARFLHKEFFEFIPTFKPWLRTNHKPIITGDDDGIWRRLVLIAFTQQFTGAQRDPYLEEKFMAERNGILAWIVEGALKWQQDGLRLSPAIRQDCASYRKDSDLLGEFIGEICVVGSADRIEQSDLYFRHQIWCQSNGVKAMTKASFTRRLAERGYCEARSNGKRYYNGLRAADVNHTASRML